MLRLDDGNIRSSGVICMTCLRDAAGVVWASATQPHEMARSTVRQKGNSDLVRWPLSARIPT